MQFGDTADYKSALQGFAPGLVFGGGVKMRSPVAGTVTFYLLAKRQGVNHFDLLIHRFWVNGHPPKPTCANRSFKRRGMSGSMQPKPEAGAIETFTDFNCRYRWRRNPGFRGERDVSQGTSRHERCRS